MRASGPKTRHPIRKRQVCAPTRRGRDSFLSIVFVAIDHSAVGAAGTTVSAILALAKRVMYHWTIGAGYGYIRFEALLTPCIRTQLRGVATEKCFLATGRTGMDIITSRFFTLVYIRLAR